MGNGLYGSDDSDTQPKDMGKSMGDPMFDADMVVLDGMGMGGEMSPDLSEMDDLVETFDDELDSYGNPL